jgi:hypothetical protein
MYVCVWVCVKCDVLHIVRLCLSQDIPISSCAHIIARTEERERIGTRTCIATECADPRTARLSDQLSGYAQVKPLTCRMRGMNPFQLNVCGTSRHAMRRCLIGKYVEECISSQHASDRRLLHLHAQRRMHTQQEPSPISPCHS